MSAEIEAQYGVVEAGNALEAAVHRVLEALERSGVSARDADEFVRDCVFNAWWDWDYKSALGEES